MKNRTTATIVLVALASTAIFVAMPSRDLSQVTSELPNTTAPANQTSNALQPRVTVPILPPNSAAPSSGEIGYNVPRLEEPLKTAELKRGLDRLTSRDIAGAISARDKLGRTSADGQILSWAIALSGQSAIPSKELEATLNALGPYPGKVTIAANYERALIRETQAPSSLVAIFSKQPPDTLEGKLSYSKALSEVGRADEALQIIRAIWQGEVLTSAHEAEVMAGFRQLLTQEDHRKRFFMLAYRGRLGDAKRFADLAYSQSLYAAWAAVEAKSTDAAKLIEAARKEWGKDPAFHFIQLRQKRMAWKYAEGAEILRSVSVQDIANTSPSAWWNEMRIIARGLMDQKAYQRAYELIAAHPAVDVTEAFDAEFHAGWLSLRYLKNPKQAELHFRKMLTQATTPITLAKAHYWLGRTLSTSNKEQSAKHFQQASRFPANFYGQLAAEYLGNAAAEVKSPEINDEDRILLAGRPLMDAINRLEQAGYAWRAEILYRTLAGELTRPGEIAQLAQRLEARGAHQVSLQVGRAAFNRGINETALAFPISAIPADAIIGDTGKALAFAIARQESSFDVGAISPANAQGLLQILPGTAKDVAGRLNIEFEPSRLTTDAGYNARLGAQYLSEQISKFDGSYILTFIAYNAGPKRVDEWIKRYGDPRKLKLDDVIDWIERIPYPETRNYVQRVMENYQVYKARLGQEANIAFDLTKGRQ